MPVITLLMLDHVPNKQESPLAFATFSRTARLLRMDGWRCDCKLLIICSQSVFWVRSWTTNGSGEERKTAYAARRVPPLVS